MMGNDALPDTTQEKVRPRGWGSKTEGHVVSAARRRGEPCAPVGPDPLDLGRAGGHARQLGDHRQLRLAPRQPRHLRRREAAEVRRDQRAARPAKMPSSLLDDAAPPARLVAPRAPVAPAHSGAQPQQLGGSQWPQQGASAGSQSEESPLVKHQVAACCSAARCSGCAAPSGCCRCCAPRAPPPPPRWAPSGASTCWGQRCSCGAAGWNGAGLQWPLVGPRPIGLGSLAARPQPSRSRPCLLPQPGAPRLLRRAGGASSCTATTSTPPTRAPCSARTSCCRTCCTSSARPGRASSRPCARTRAR